MQGMKLGMDGLENILGYGELMRPLELTHLDENGNPSWKSIALRESLSGQLLGIL